MTETERKTAEEWIEAATWVLIDNDTDIVDRGVREEHYRERRAEVEMIAPIFEAGLLVGEPSEEQIDAAGLAIARVLFPRWRDAARRDHARDKNSLIRVAACNALAACEAARYLNRGLRGDRSEG